MSSGLFAAVSGIRANQTRLNVISNNISNVNTVGFKSSSVNFATLFANTISGGGAPNGNVGGTNPKQIGSGTVVSDIPANFSQGGTQFTGRNTDMQISGEGFFAVEKPDGASASVSSNFYLTRAGNFSVDSNGNLVTASGNRVRGTGQLSGSSSTTLRTIQIPQELLIVKDLAASGTTVQTHFAPVGTSAGSISAAINSGATTQTTTNAKLISFSVGVDGAVTASYSNGDRISIRTQASTVSASDPTTARREIIHMPAEGGTYGASSGSTDSGTVTQIGAVFTNGAGTASLQGAQFQLQMATVTNPQGLQFDGNNNFLTGPNSGSVNFGSPSSESRGALQSGALESSNVDLAGEFSSLIIAQRGLEANSKIIRTQSEVMQSVINII
jgi:flagellar hook protein FlgE